MDRMQSTSGSFMAGNLSLDDKGDLSQFNSGTPSPDVVTTAVADPLKSLGYIKEEVNVDGLANSELQFIPDARGKCGNQIIQGQVPIVSQVVPFTSSSGVVCTSTNGMPKSLSGHQALLPVNLQSSSLAIQQTDCNLVSTNANMSSQPVQMFQSASFESCEAALNSQQPGPAFLLTPSGTVLSSAQIASQGQVFLQGDELVGVSLPGASSPQFTTTVAGSHFQNNIPFIQGTSQTASNTPARIIIQTNQPSSNTIQQQPILSTNNGHYLIQVGNSYPNSAQLSNVTMNNKGHIVIRSGSTKIKTEPQDLATQTTKDGVFRVVIPEGTTKIDRTNQSVASPKDMDALKKLVQINLSNKATPMYQSKSPMTAVPIQPMEAENSHIVPEKVKAQSQRKLYECNICNCKFMRPLYLRMHARSCKKPEVKLEKPPLFLCSFCKNSYKTKEQINIHFASCSQNPYNEKNHAQANLSGPPLKKEKLDVVDNSLEQAVQYKCQDCDRTFNKERQYTSHIRRCTKISVHDLTGARAETGNEEQHEDENDGREDPFADPPAILTPSKRGRGSSGRRGRPPGRVAAAVKANSKTNVLFEGDKVSGVCNGLLVADNENLVRSTTALAHTVQSSLETASQDGNPPPMALVSDSKGVKGRERPPQAWSLVCSLCQKMFLTKAALATHVINKHGPDLHSTRNILLGKENNNSCYRCPLCNYYYSTSDSLIEHLVLQHTGKLQDCHARLQGQTGSFICSICSLVLLTKNLLMEHLCMEHLDDMEACVLRQKSRGRRQLDVKTEKIEDEGSSLDQWDAAMPSPPVENWDSGLAKVNEKPGGGTSLECSFCSQDIPSQEDLIQHYTVVHGMEMDSDGRLLDLGIDVDVKIKETKNLIEIANGGKMDKSKLPERTVLIRKKPKQNWQCQNCFQVFNSQMSYMRHVREQCGGLQDPKGVDSFFCRERECSHLAFHQVKSLFKHMEDVHSIVVNRERKSFKQIMFFYQWLTNEEKRLNVKFVKENSKYERNNVKFIQLVCQKFQSSRLEQAKEKEADLAKMKKRWFVRLQRSSNCLARIHLRVELNTTTNEYDGETQMIYYPDHSHDGESDESLIDKMIDRHPKNRALNMKNNGAVVDLGGPLSMNVDSSGSLRASSGTTQQMDSLETTDTDMLISTRDTTASIPQYLSASTSASAFPSSCSVSTTTNPGETSNLLIIPDNIKKRGKTGNAVVSSAVILTPTSSLSQQTAALMADNTVSANALIMDGSEARLLMSNGSENQTTTMLITKDLSASDAGAGGAKSDDVNSFMVQDNLVVGLEQNPQHQNQHQHQIERESNHHEEYILPADESEWTKLFDVLKARLNAAELDGDEKTEGEAVLTYQTVISMISLREQVSIFQKLCSLTNTSLESV